MSSQDLLAPVRMEEKLYQGAQNFEERPYPFNSLALKGPGSSGPKSPTGFCWVSAVRPNSVSRPLGVFSDAGFPFVSRISYPREE